MFFNLSRQFNFDDQRDESNVMSVRIYSIWIIFKNGMVHMIVNLKSESKMKTTKIIQSRDKSSSTIFGGEHISAKSWPSSICFAFRWIWNPFCLSQDSSLVLGGPNLFYGALCFRVLKLQSNICRHGQQNHHLNYGQKWMFSLGLEPTTTRLRADPLYH